VIELNGVRDALAELTAIPPRFFRVPGCVTLLGDETAPADGFALTVACDRAVVVAYAPRSDDSVNAVVDGRRDARYAELGRSLATAGGADIAMRGTIPPGLAEATTAAYEVGIALAVLRDRDAAAQALAAGNGRGRRPARATSLYAERDHALLVDARSAEASRVPLDTREVAIVLCDPRLRDEERGLRAAARVAACEEAAAMLRRKLPKVRALRDVSLADFLRTADTLPEALQPRVRHIVTENVRVLQAVAALRAGDFAALGKHMNDSHESLRDDFGAGAPELDLLAAAARSAHGVYGARMTATDGGGAVIALVRREALAPLRAQLAATARTTFSRDPTIVDVRPLDGAQSVG
jgi:galactokinase